LQDKATGNKAALWLRAKVQNDLLRPLGRLAQRHPAKVLTVGILVLATLCFGLKGATIQTRVDKLWVQGEKV